MLALGLVVVPATAPAAPASVNRASIALGAAAKLVCSGVFVSGRSLDEVVRLDIKLLLPPGSDFTYRIDRAGATITARVGPLARVAKALPGVGCALTYGEDHRVAAVPAAPAKAAVRVVAAASPALAAALDAAMMDSTPDHLLQPRALVVLRHGKIVGERYATGFGPTTPMLGWSMSKSVNAIVARLLVADGRLALDDKVGAPE